MDEFDNFSVNWKTGELICGEQRSLLEPKLIAVLALLTKAEGELVTYEEMNQSVWPNVVVAPNALQRIIAQLRRHLNDSAKTQSVIKTHPKRGYSLVVLKQKENIALPAKKTIERSSTFVYRALILFFVFCFIIAVTLLWSSQSEKDLTVHTLQAIDIESGQFSHLTVIDEHSFVFVDKQTPQHQLVLHNSKSSQRRILIDDMRLYGKLNYSSSSNALFFGRTVVKNSVKCAQLTKFSLTTRKEELLMPCTNHFNHSIIETEPSKLLFVKTNKEGISKLQMLDYSTGESEELIAPSFSQFTKSPVSDSYAIQIENQLYLAKRDGKSIVLSEAIFKFRDDQYYPFIWLTPETLLVGEGKHLYWLGSSGVIAKQILQTTTDITELKSYKEHLYATFGRENWQTRIRFFTSPAREQDVARSIFNEQFASFRPDSEDISLLSNRSGNMQVWLSVYGEMHQLTQGTDAVSGYVWLDKQRMAIMREGELFVLTLNEGLEVAEKSITHEVTMQSIFQYSDEKLLVKAQVKNETYLGLLDITSGGFQPFYQGDVDWAQLSSSGTILLNMTSQIMKLEGSELMPLEGLNDVVLQWRYFNRNGKIYLQDKQQNVWRYDESTDTKTKVGEFGLGSLFMTDYSIKHNAMLSDNFIAEKNELVELKTYSD